MKSILVEILDRGTSIPVMATSFVVSSSPENYETETQRNVNEFYVLRDGGFRKPGTYVLITRLADQQSTCDPLAWDDKRVMFNAHKYIETYFEELDSGGMLDIEFILGERDMPCWEEWVDGDERLAREEVLRR